MIQESMLFEEDARSSASRVGNTLQSVLEHLPKPVRKAADLKKVLNIDSKLSWQVFTMATGREPLRASLNLPGNNSMTRFFEAAREGGAPTNVVADASKAYEEFEAVIERHAGDRTTFNSMVSAIGEGDNDEDEAVDTAHRQAMFRAMSHYVGQQYAVGLRVNLLRRTPGTGLLELGMLSGYQDLKVLRPLDEVAVIWAGLGDPTSPLEPRPTMGPLKFGPDAFGYLIPEYSTEPYPKMRLSDDPERPWMVGEVMEPKLGTLGMTSATFGMWYQNLAYSVEHFETIASVWKPTKVYIMDLLLEKNLFGNEQPRMQVNYGVSNNYTRASPVSAIPVAGNWKLERMGHGLKSLRTSDIPRYEQLLKDCYAPMKPEGAGDDWLDQFEAWRVRIEYPLFQSRMVIRWNGK